MIRSLGRNLALERFVVSHLYAGHNKATDLAIFLKSSARSLSTKVLRSQQYRECADISQQLADPGWSGRMLDGRYAVKKIGSGSLNDVFLGMDKRTGLFVAIKEVTEPMRDLLMANIISAEAEAVIRIDHPSVVGFVEVLGNPARYLVEEFVFGCGVDQLQLTSEEISAILIQALFALSAAHRVGVCHNDHKLANYRVDTEGRLKLIDFNLAKVTSNINTPASIADVKADLFSLVSHFVSALGGNASFAHSHVGRLLIEAKRATELAIESESSMLPYDSADDLLAAVMQELNL